MLPPINILVFYSFDKKDINVWMLYGRKLIKLRKIFVYWEAKPTKDKVIPDLRLKIE